MKKNNLNENTLKRLIRSILLENDSEIKDKKRLDPLVYLKTQFH